MKIFKKEKPVRTYSQQDLPDIFPRTYHSNQYSCDVIPRVLFKYELLYDSKALATQLGPISWQLDFTHRNGAKRSWFFEGAAAPTEAIENWLAEDDVIWPKC